MSDQVLAKLPELRREFDAGVERYGELGLTFEAYAGEALRAVDRRLDTLGLEITATRVADGIGRMAGADLYLARACEVGSIEGWGALARDLVPRLTGLAHEHGARGPQADTVVGQLLSELALPPARGRARTLIGTYGGAGSLFGWLSVNLLERILGPAQDGALATPPKAAHQDEVSAERTQVRAAIRAGYEACTPREQLVLVFRFRDGLAPATMAKILRVGEPRVGRLVKQALKRLSRSIRGHLPEELRAAAWAEASSGGLPGRGGSGGPA